MVYKQFRWIHFVALLFCLFQDSPSYWNDSLCLNSNFTKIVRLNYHFICDDENQGNFSSVGDGIAGLSGFSNGYEYAKAVISQANLQINYHEKLWLPKGNKYARLPVRVQYTLDSVYFHKNNFWHEHSQKPNDFSLHHELGEKVDRVINIYDIGNRPKGFSEGITSFRNRAIKLFSPYPILEKVIEDTSMTLEQYIHQVARLLNHEMGHVFGLEHTWSFWNLWEGCEDTPNHNNCWNLDLKNPNCDSWEEISNNIMDYNPYIAYSPCQIEKIHKNLEGQNRYYVAKCVKCEDGF